MAMRSDGTDEWRFHTQERTNGWRVLDPERWSNNWLTQIHELEVFHQNGFITQDGVKWGVRAGGSMLGVVVADLKACETKAMACPSYWAIHLCMCPDLRFPQCDNGDETGPTAGSRVRWSLTQHLSLQLFIYLERLYFINAIHTLRRCHHCGIDWRSDA